MENWHMLLKTACFGFQKEGVDMNQIIKHLQLLPYTNIINCLLLCKESLIYSSSGTLQQKLPLRFLLIMLLRKKECLNLNLQEMEQALLYHKKNKVKTFYKTILSALILFLFSVSGFATTLSLSPSTLTAGTLTTITASDASGSFSITDQGGNTVSFTTISSTEVSFTPQAGYTYTMSYKKTTGAGTTTLAQITATTGAAPSPTVSFNSPQTTFCSNGTTYTNTVTVNPTGGTLVISGTGITQSGTSYTFNPATGGAGTQLITATYTTTDGTAVASTSFTVNSTPITQTLTASPATYCIGTSGTTLFLNSSETGVTYQLNKNGSASGTALTGTGGTLSWANQTAGTYTVTETNTAGCIITTSSTTISTTPLPTSYTLSGPSSFCTGSSASLVLSGSQAGVNYVLYNGSTPAGTASGNGSAITWTVNSPGTYSVVATNTNGCSNNMNNTINLTENTLPTASITPSISTVCAGSSVNLAASGGVSYSWTPATGLNTTTSSNVIATPTASTTYTVTVTDINGCKNTATTAITVNKPQQVNAGSDKAICSGTSTTLLATGSTSYTWDNGLGSGASHTITPTTTTTYNVTGTDANGCTSTDTVTITVNPLPSANAGSNVEICKGSSTTLTATGGTSYYWNTTGATSAAITVSPLTTTSYIVTVSYASGCWSQANVQVTVNNNPTVSAGTDQYMCQGSSTTISATATSGNPAYTYLWSDGEKFQTINVNPTNLTTVPIIYTYSVIATDSKGCMAYDTMKLTVNPLPVVSISNLANSYCHDQGTLTVTGVPTGSTGVFSISYDPAGTFHDNGNGTATFNPSSEPAGSYYDITYTYTDGNGCVNTTHQMVYVRNEVSPTPTITGIDPLYCDDNTATITATGTPTPTGTSTGVFTGNVTDLHNGTATFVPSTLGIGNYSATYTYTNYYTTPVAGQCSGSATKDFTVGIPVTFNTLPNYCVSSGSFLLTVNKPTATANGTFVVSKGGIPLYSGAEGTATFNPSAQGPGTYTITYSTTTTGTVLCSGTASTTVTVNSLPSAAFTIDGVFNKDLNITICQNGGLATLAGNPNAGGTFSCTDVPGAVSGNKFNPVTAGVGFHTIKYEYTDSKGCTSDTTGTIQVLSIPVTSIISDSIFCHDHLPVTLIGNPKSGNSGYGVWTGPTGWSSAIFTDNGDGTASLNPQLVPVGIDTFTIVYKLPQQTGCVSSARKKITVNYLPTVDFSGLSDSICENASSISLLGSPIVTTGTTGVFSGNGITDNTNGTASFKPTGLAQTSQPITYSFTDTKGCSAAKTRNIYVKPAPKLYDVTGGGTYCINGGTTTNYVRLSNSESGTSYQLYLNGAPYGSVVKGTGAALSFGLQTLSGTYTVVATGTNSCTLPMNGSATVVINPLPQAATSVTGTSKVCPNATYTYTTPAILNATSYTWTLPTGATITSGAGTNTITVLFATSGGNIVVAGTNSCGNGTSFTFPITMSALPIAAGTITGSANVCQGSTLVSYNVPAITNATSYTWTVPPSGVTIHSGSTNNTVVLDFSSTALSGTLTVAGVNSCGTGTSSTISINVVPTPTITIDPASGVVNCTGTPVTITGHTSSDPSTSTYQWVASNGGHIISGTATTATTSVDAVGTYTLTVTEPVNSCKSSANVTVNEDKTAPQSASITSSISSNTITCTNPQADLTASTTSTFSVSYAWTYTTGGNIVSGNGTSTIRVDKPATYTVTITNTATGCTATKSITISSDQLDPVITMNKTLSQLNCKNTQVQLSASAPNSTYLWTASGTALGATFTGGNTIANPLVNKPGLYTLTATGTNGCVATDNVTVVQDLSVPLAVSIDTTTTGTGTLTCTVQSLQLKANTSTTSATYSWTPSNGGHIKTGTGTTSQLVTADAAGDYTVTITHPTTYCTTTAMLQVKQNTTLPVISFPVAPSAITCSSATSTINSVVAPTAATYTYQWTGPSSSTISTPTAANTIVNKAGTYSLTATSNINGCSSTNSVTVDDQTAAPLVTIASPSVITCANNVTLAGSTSLTNYTAAWTGPVGGISGSTSNINAIVTLPGTYALTITNNLTGCTGSASTTVSSNKTAPNISVNGTPANLTCSSTTVTLSSSSTTSNATFLWTGPAGATITNANSPTPTVDKAGTYTLTVTDPVNGCTSTGTVTVSASTTAPSAPVILAPADLTCSKTTTDLVVSPTPSNVNYLWTTAGTGTITNPTSSTATVNNIGTYTVTITDRTNGCTNQANVTVSKNSTSPIPAITGGPYQITCSAPSLVLDGSSSTGINPTWTASNGGNIAANGNTTRPTVDAAGTYTLTTTDATSGCTASTSVAVSAATSLPTYSVNTLPDAITCSKSTVTLSGQPLQAGNTFTWTASPGHIVSGETGFNPIVDQAGYYIFEVTNPTTGCSSKVVVIVKEKKTAPILSVATPATITCSTTQVQLTASTTSTNVSYAWTVSDGGSLKSGTENTQSPIALTKGSYTVLLTDIDNSCTSTQTVEVDKNTTEPQVSIDQNPAQINCTNNKVTLTGSSSTSGVSYKWRTTGTGNIYNPTLASTPVDNDGDYYLTVTNPVNGCTNTASVHVDKDIITPDVDIASVTDILTKTVTTVQLNGSSTTANVTFKWTGPGNISAPTSQTTTVDAPGTYTLTVTATNGCTNSKTITVSQDLTKPAAPSATGATICYGSAAGILSAIGTSIKWYSDATLSVKLHEGSSFTPSGYTNVGVYNFYVTQTSTTNGNESAATQVSYTIKGLPLSPTVSDKQVCQGSANPELTATGATSSTIKWYDMGTGGSLIGTGASYTPPTSVSAPGSYSYYATQTDTYDCESSTTEAKLTINPLLNLTVGTPDVLTCANNNHVTLNGSADISGATLLWTGPGIESGASSEHPVVTAPGTYTLTATNTTTGCSAVSSASVTVTKNNTTPTVGFSVMPGTITCSSPTTIITGSSSATNNKWQWSTSDGTFASGTSLQSVTVSAKGNYVLTVTDTDNGCSDSKTVSVDENKTTPVATIADPAHITCNATTITLSGSVTGTPVSVEWTPTNGGYIPVGSKNSLTPTVSSAGTYTMTATNTVSGCQSSATVTVIDDRSNTPVITINTSPSALDCKTTTVQLYGTATNASLLWTGPSTATITDPTTSTPTVNMEGDYTLTATDNTTGCKSTATVTVKSNVATVAVPVINTPGTLNCNNPTINLSATSTVANALYAWTVVSGGNITSTSNTSTITVDGIGEYKLTITNPSNYCTSNASVTVSKNVDAPIISFPTTPSAITCTATATQLNSTVTTTTSSVADLLWTGPGTISNATVNNPIVNAAGTYTLTATDVTTGCSSSKTITVISKTTPPEVSINTPSTLTCKTTSGIILTGTSSVTNFTALWATSDGSISGATNQLTATVLKKGTYTLTVTNNDNGCSTTKSVTVSDDLTVPDISVDQNPAKITCTNLTTTLFGSSSTANATLQWTGPGIVSGAATSSPVVNVSGSYILTVTGNNGCTATNSVTVGSDKTAPSAPVILTPDTLSCKNSSVNISVSNPTSDVTYSWTTTNASLITNASTSVATVTEPGSYTVRATNKVSGCYAESSVTVIKNIATPVFSIDPGPYTITCTTTSLTIKSSATTGINPQWSVSNGGHISAGGSTFTPVVDAAGTYTLTVTNPTSKCTSTQSIDVAADVSLPGLSIMPYADTLTCKRTSVTLTGKPTDSSDAFTWTESPGHFVSDQTTYNPVVDQPGSYILTVTSHTTGCTRIASVSVVQNIVQPVITINKPDSFYCSTSEVLVKASADITKASYSWATSGTGTGLIKAGYENTANTIVLASGTYEVTVKNLENNCTSSKTVTVGENLTKPTLAVNKNPDQLTCTRSSVILSGSSTNSVNFLWYSKVTGTKIDNATTAHPTVYATGKYYLQITDANNGCVSIDSVTVSEDKTAPQIWANTKPDSLTCTRSLVQLSGSSTTTGATYSWTGPGTISQSNIRDPFVDTKGVYTLTITDPVNGCTSSVDVNVIENKVVPAAPLANNAENCIQSITTPLTATGSSLNWYTDPAATSISKAGSGSSFMPSDNTVGTYTYYVTQTDPDNGCESSVTQVSFVINAKSPSPTVPSTVEVCYGAATPLLTVQGTNVKWYDAPNGNLLASGNSFSTGKTDVGSYLYYATQTTSTTGCESDPIVVQLIIHKIPDVPVLEKTDIAICSGTAIPSLNASGSSVQWYADNLLVLPVATGNSYTPSISSSGVYSYYATQTDIYGCESQSVEAKITINALPTIYKVTGGGNFCEGDVGVPVGLSGSTSNDIYQLLLNGSFTTAILKTGTGSALDFGNQVNEGIYTVQAISTNACTNKMEGGVSVIQHPLPYSAGSIQGETTVCQGATVSYIADSISYATTYEWSLPSGASIVTGGSTRKIMVYFDKTAISGDITVRGKNDCGYGSLSSAKGITVNLLPGDATGTITGPSQVCQGETWGLFSFPEISNATSYEWTIPAGATIVSGAGTNQIAVDFTSNDVGGYFTVRGVTSCGKGSISTPFYVTLKNKPYVNAGYDQTTCSSTGKLEANTPALGATGQWTTIVGPAAVSNINDPNSNVFGLMMGENKLVWTVTQDGCSASDTVKITNNKVVVDAGEDQVLCSKVTSLNAVKPLTNCMWTIASGSAVIFDPESPTSTISGLAQGVNKLVWSIYNGSCVSSDTVNIINNKPVTPNAGTSFSTKTDTARLSATAPESGTTGTWSVLSGAGSFEDKNSPTSRISGLNPGVNTLLWTVTRGGCSLTDTINVNYLYTENADAGTDQEICTDNTTLEANEPVTGIGQWSVVKGAATFADASLYNTKVYALANGKNYLKWTIRKGGAISVSDTVIITNNSVTVANAGTIQTLCSDSTVLAANKPIYGVGKWSVINGSGVFADTSSYNTKIKGLASGNNVLKWTITKESCYSESLVTIINNTPTTADAGNDIKTCSDSVTLYPNTPTVGDGAWSVISGSALISSSNSAYNLANGQTVLRWTITKGTCKSTDDITITNHKATQANAGVDQIICVDSIMLGGNKPLVGKGVWTVQSGSATITDTTKYNSLATNLALGKNILRWTITNYECSSFDEVQIYDGFIQASAGLDQVLCDSTALLRANSTTIGQGTWSIVGGKGSATFANIHAANSQVTNLGRGVNTLRWTISNETCVSHDDVTITNNAPSDAYAGPDVAVCSNSTYLDANPVLVGTGKWQVLSGAGFINDTSQYNSRIDSLGLGSNTLRWTVTNKGCSSSDEVKITNNQPIMVSAGKDQVLCVDSTYLYANKPSIGTGQWSIITGSAEFTNDKQYDTYVSRLGKGTNILKWTVTSGQCIVSDTVQVTNNQPSISMAGPDQILCQDSVQMSANNPTYGKGEWIVIEGSGDIEDKTKYNTWITNLGSGQNQFRWQINLNNCTTEDEATITNNLPTTPYAGVKQAVCADSTVLYANIPEVGKGSWTVVAGNGLIAHADSNQTKVNKLIFGTNTFRWTIKNQNCTLYSDVVVTDNLAEVNAGVDQVVFTTTASLIGNVPAKGTGTWSLTAGTGTIKDPDNFSTTVTGLGSGKNTFMWAIENDGCIASDLVNIAYYVMPVLNFAPDTAEGCPPLTISFVNKSIGGSPYHWDFGDGYYSDNTNDIHTYTNAGTYTVKMTASAPDGSTMEKDTIITVHILPKAAFDVTPKTVYIPGQSISCFNTSVYADRYIWSFGDSTYSSDANPKHEYKDTGTYVIKLKALTQFNCADSTTNEVIAKDAGRIVLPSAFTPNPNGSSNGHYSTGDFSNDVFYPIVIKGSIEKINMQIFNRWGIKIFESTDVTVGWDGYYQNKLLAQDVYVYVITGTFTDGTSFKKIGDILLVRKK
jgi:gliding motility-associated-like protein